MSDILVGAHLQTAITLRDTSRFIEADAIVTGARLQFPTDIALAILHAELAHAQSDFEAALGRWRQVRDLAPSYVDGWLMPGSLLFRRLARLDEADALLTQGVETCPDDFALAGEHAWCAVNRRDLLGAKARYNAIRCRFPERPEGHFALMGTLRDLSLFDEADEVAVPALLRFPENKSVLLAHAWTAHFRRDWPEAVQRWNRLRQCFPEERLGHVMAAKTLFKELGQADIAEPLLLEAVRRFPDDLEIGCDFAAVAGARGDLKEALCRWQKLSLDRPHDITVIAGRGDAELRLLNTSTDADQHDIAVRPDSIVAIQNATSSTPLRDFFGNFESLGFNCEFGLVQRHFGAEPLGLLRWNALTPPNLIAALENRFDGLHSKDDIELKVVRGEWVVVEKRYNMVMHTFLLEAEVNVNAERFHMQMWRRMRFLRDKLVEDLGLNHKLLVYKCWETLSDHDLQRLFLAVRAYGTNTLLYVRDGAVGDCVGQVDRAAPGLLLGQIDRFVRHDEGWNTLSSDAWLAVCRNAHRLWRSFASDTSEATQKHIMPARHDEVHSSPDMPVVSMPCLDFGELSSEPEESNTPLLEFPAVKHVQPAREPAVAPVTTVARTPDDVCFRVPQDLSISQLEVKRALVIGACFSEVFAIYLFHAFPNIKTDHLVYNFVGALPEQPPHPLEQYDFQLVMLPLRTLMPEQVFFRLSFDDHEGYKAAFEEARECLSQMIRGALAYREEREITTFVANYMVPQQNLMGRLLPRYDLRNPVYFVEKLNQALAEEIAGLSGVHLLDVEQISANFGRKYFQDDVISLSTHGSYAADYEAVLDANRIEVPLPLSHHHPFRVAEVIVAICFEIKAMFRTLQQVDQVKLVIVDLDDTLWRGVVAEEGLDHPGLTEGWPVGLVEALTYLKRRGVLLAIVSKNDEERIRALWPYIYGSRLELSDFASVQINWRAKPDNVAKILEDTNLLPRSVIFIDDNPVERAGVEIQFPEMRILGASPYALRRILLWASETQVAHVTNESSRRTEMVQAQLDREKTRKRLTRAEFLDTLNVAINIYAVSDIRDRHFARALELINKSNQFNTTGSRWLKDGCKEFFGRGGIFWVFEVEDRFTHYGLVGVAIVASNRIIQFVMSCRVVGLDVENAVIFTLDGIVGSELTAAFIATDANFLCSDLFARCGFTECDGFWVKPAELIVVCPAHMHRIKIHYAVMADSD